MQLSSFAPEAYCTLTAHNVLPVANNKIALMSRLNSGWVMLESGNYEILLQRLSSPIRLNEFGEAEMPIAEDLWNAGLLEVDHQTVIDGIRAKNTPNDVLIKMTNRCNYACTYCYDFHANDDNTDLELVRIQESLDYVLKQSNGDKITISFHGGEPLLQFNKIRDLVSYVECNKASSQVVNFSVQTNGTLFTEDVISFLSEKEFSVGISLDGSTEVANRHRPSKKGVTPLGHVERLIASHPDFVHNHCGMMAVLTEASVDHIPEFAIWLQDHDVTSLSLVLFQSTGRAENRDPNPVSSAQIIALYDKLIKMIEDGIIDRIFVKNLISCLVNFLFFANGEICYRGVCMASKNFLVLGSDGSFKICDCSDQPEFILGNSLADIASDPFERRKEIVNRSRVLGQAHPKCKSCDIYGLCGGGCAARASTNNKDFYSIDEIECDLFIHLYKRLLNDYASGNNTLFDYYRRYASQK